MPDAMTRPIEDYEREARELFEALQSGEMDAAWRFKWEHPRFRGRPVTEVEPASLELSDARTVIARDHGFEGWADLVRFTGDVKNNASVARFETAVEAVIDGDVETLRTLLAEDSNLIRERSTRRHHATLLHYTAANGVENERQKTPPNAVEIATLLLESGAEPDALSDAYDEQCTTLSMLVSSSPPADAGLQVALAETLLDHGAAVEGAGSKWRSAVMTALTFGFPDTARALVRRGGPVETLPAAAGLGLLDESARLLADADARSRHEALALAAHHGHADIVKLLLDAGEDPNRYNPDSFHSHATPLHHAALANHDAVVRLLVERGARLDIADTIYGSTPLGWAEHGGNTAIADYLRNRTTDGP